MNQRKFFEQLISGWRQTNPLDPTALLAVSDFSAFFLFFSSPET